MKKLQILTVFLLPFASMVRADSSSGAAAAGVAAGLFSGIAASALMSSGSSKSSSQAEAQAVKAREENEQMRREYEKDRVEQLRRDQERKDLERKDEQIRQLNEHLRHIERQSSHGSSNTFVLYLLFGFILLLTTAVGVLALLLFRKR